MATIENSSFLDMTAWRLTTATTVKDAYKLREADITEPPAGQTVTVGLMLERANDPTSLLKKDWAARQQDLADETLWTKYGADRGTYDTVTAALGDQGIEILNGTAGWVGSAESRMVWVKLSAVEFKWLFGTELKYDSEYEGGLSFWDGDLSLDHSWGGRVAGLWMDFGEKPKPEFNQPAVYLPPGPQSPGNSATTVLPQYPNTIAQLYDFPLSATDARTATIGLMEPGIGIPTEAGIDPRSPAARESFTTLVETYRQGAGIDAPADIYVSVQADQDDLSEGSGQSGSGEMALDVGVVTLAAPNSRMGIYGGPQDAWTKLPTYQAAIWDTDNDPAVLSSSFNESIQPAPDSPFQKVYDELYVDAALRNISFMKSSGDTGSAGRGANGVPNVEVGKASPYVVVVGGTSISLSGNAATDPTLDALVQGAKASDPATLKQLIGGGLKVLPSRAADGSLFVEAAWNEYTLHDKEMKHGYTGNNSSSGGVDPRVPIPDYQSDYGLSLVGAGPNADTGRGIPDVAALSDGNTKYTVPSADFTTTNPDGGTSASAPLWAALTAQIHTIFTDQGLPGLGYYNDLLYIAAAVTPGAFNDVTLGNNVSSYRLEGPITSEGKQDKKTQITPTGYGYGAGPDYDLVTGLGTPNGLLLARSLTAIAHAQMSSDAPALLDPAGSASAAAQHLLVQSSLKNDHHVAVTAGGTANRFDGTAASSLAWSSAFAQKALQADFDPALVRLFDSAAQGTAYDLGVADGTSLSVSVHESAATVSRAAMTSPFGFVDYEDADGNGVRLARAVAVAQTAGGADDQQAVVRLRQNTTDEMSIAFYRVDDLDGTIDGLAPSQAGYDAAVTGRLYATTTGGTAVAGPGYGLYTQALLSGVDNGDLIAMTVTSGFYDKTVSSVTHDYYGFSAANESAGGRGVTHLWNYGLNTWGWEGTYGGGDLDYNDLVVQLDFTSASGSGWLVQDPSAGSAGDDASYGDEGANRVTAAAGDDTVYGAAGLDTLFGGTGDDLVSGQDGDDFVGAGAGNDFGSGGWGNDEVHGEQGNDLLFGDDGNDGVYGEDGDDLVYGGTGDDYVTGDAGNDRIFGEDGNDGLSGGAGDDTLEGGAGTDLLFGNSGDDVLTGGAGADIFAFGRGDGRDAILDFVTGGAEADVIAFNGGAFGDFAGVLAASRQEGSDVVIAYGTDDVLTLRGVQLATLSAANVSFA